MSDPTERPFVSVIIPVYNDERLRTCLAALENQAYPKDRYEVIAVDNGSREPIEPAARGFTQVKTAAESKPGSYAARNKGIRLSRGTLIAFTDADCIPAPDWIEKGVEALEGNPTCGLVGGRIDLFFKDARRPTSAELYDVVMIGLPQRRFVEESHYGATANVFTRREVIDRVGPFDDTLKSSGDNEWGKRVFAAGYGQVYADDVRVSHPARDSVKQLLRKVIRVAGGHFDTRTKRGYPLWELGRDVARELVAFRVFFLNWSNEHLGGAGRKARFYGLVFVVKYTRAFELLRLRLGGRSVRG